MSERLPSGERRLTVEDVVRPLRNSAVALRRLKALERKYEKANPQFLGHLARIGSQRGGYLLSPEALTPDTTPPIANYLSLFLCLEYARVRVPIYTQALQQGLESRLKPTKGPRPILHVRNEVTPFGQIGTLHNNYGRSDIIPNSSNIRMLINEFSGECVRVRDGFIYIATEERAVYKVNPLSESGYPNPDVQLAISYPEE